MTYHGITSAVDVAPPVEAVPSVTSAAAAHDGAQSRRLVGADRPRVLHVGKHYPPVPGGMERVLQLLCERERHVIDSRVLVVNDERTTRRETVTGVSVTRAGRVGVVGSVSLSPRLAVELHRAPADLTVLHEPNPMALVADFVTQRRSPLVVYFHSEVVRPEWRYQVFYRPFLTRVLTRAARIIVASPPMVEAAAQLEGYRHKCVVIPYGIETDCLQCTPDIEARATAIRSRSPGPLLLFVGRLVPYKGVDVILRALPATTGRLAIVGEGPLRQALQGLASDLGVADRVDFLGAVSDPELLALYHACDAFVLPSVTRAEAFGMVQIEAMACGKPVISTDVPSGVSWVNRHDETGLVVRAGDAAALAGAIRTLCADDVLRRRLGAGGRRRVEREFTAARMAERTVALYREVLNGVVVPQNGSRRSRSAS